MKKIITVSPSKGFPLTNDDIDLLQEAHDAELKSIIEGLTASSNLIVSGCEITYSGGIYNVATGILCVAGVLYKVEAHSINPSTSILATRWDTYYEPIAPSPVEYADLVSRNSHFEKKARLSNSAPLSSPTLLDTQAPLKRRVFNSIGNRVVESPTILTGWSLMSSSFFAEAYGREVRLSGRVRRLTASGSTTNEPIFQLSDAFRPHEAVVVPVLAYDSITVGNLLSGMVTTYLIVNPDGYCYSSMLPPIKDICLNGVSFYRLNF